ncbi:hypothetical protein [Chitinophaga pinensis]|uniref:Uncharacterized protein n=1 Tax=Chitinophaga pinensis (strain ATCC 43595 / DSM 2588 / LMG 13176 / NBRC 15968 / NCIMB 11800 / UQM 2034) TaxID=485918 RepID=A0A979GZR6_CHIPD|nr:hypothetical protein [Chitinophaga pinensis]ACU64146.1 hypothetical protein Cpin_6745 [Chitinophaga pinensis DSM 2588]
MPVSFRYCMLFLLILITTTTAAQSKADIEKLAVTPKKSITLPIDYAISLPRPDVAHWDSDYNLYRHFMTPTVQKTQMGMAYEKDGVHIWMVVPSATPHAQLDTMMRITDPGQLVGTWRAVSHRRIHFQDSARYDKDEIVRKNTLMQEQNDDDVFLQISDKQLRLSAKEPGKQHFKREAGGRYVLDGGRYLLSYKLAKAGGAVSQVGIDKEGRLVMHSAIVEERKVPGSYIVYIAVINQFVYERVSEQP